MNPPIFLLAAAILFWGWQSGHEAVALVLAVLLEVGAVKRLQHPVSPLLLSRVANACVLAFAAMTAYFVASDDLTVGVLSIVRWLPIVLAPLFLTVRFGGVRHLPLSAISSIARWRSRRQIGPLAHYDMAFVWVALCLLAAGVANSPGPGFYLGMAALACWLLWLVRPRQRSPLVWLLLLALVLGGGASINLGLYRLQGIMEQAAMDWIAGDSDEDPQRTQTELGHIGQLKLSGAVAMQVTSEQPLAQPLLLRTASYNYYLAPSWLVTGERAFVPLPRKRAEQHAWQTFGAAGSQNDVPADRVAQADAAPHQLGIAATSKHNSTVLALPPGSSGIESSRFLHLERNPLGTVQAALEKGFYSYQVSYGPGIQDHGAPREYDLVLPRTEAAVLQALAVQLQLQGQPTAEKLARVKAWFAANYRYSTARGGVAAGQSAVLDFLQRDRRGHCEHFATASVLLLRAAGVPARYAVGYLVQEPNRFGSGYVVRQRHAHAWTLVWVDGAWQDFDTTPASWPTLEQNSGAIWEPLFDTASWLWYQVRQWRFTQTQMLLLAMLVLVVIFLRPKFQAWRSGRKPPQRAAKPHTKTAPEALAEEVQERAFYAIEAALAKRGLARPAHEALMHWQARIQSQLPPEAASALREVLRLHYRCRFGPQPAPEQARMALREGCREWLARFGGKQ